MFEIIWYIAINSSKVWWMVLYACNFSADYVIIIKTTCHIHFYDLRRYKSNFLTSVFVVAVVFTPGSVST